MVCFDLLFSNMANYLFVLVSVQSLEFLIRREKKKKGKREKKKERTCPCESPERSTSHGYCRQECKEPRKAAKPSASATDRWTPLREDKNKSENRKQRENCCSGQ